LFGVNP